MKIYTKTGDTGETSLQGGLRVSKDELRIQAYGALDELNTVLGLVLAEPSIAFLEPLKAHLMRVQGELFQIGAELSNPEITSKNHRDCKKVAQQEIGQLEQEIDVWEEQLPKLTTFVLPGGSILSAQLHFARAVSRRAERELVSLHRLEPVRPLLLQYLNRLSDYLFVAARYANYLQGVNDLPWIAPQ